MKTEPFSQLIAMSSYGRPNNPSGFHGPRGGSGNMSMEDFGNQITESIDDDEKLEFETSNNGWRKVKYDYPGGSGGFSWIREEATPLTPNYKRDETTYDKPYKELVTEGDVKLDYEDADTTVEIKVANGIRSQWWFNNGERDNYHNDGKWTDLGYITVKFHNSKEAKKFADKAKKYVDKFINSRMKEYHNKAGIQKIEKNDFKFTEIDDQVKSDLKIPEYGYYDRQAE